MLELSWINRLFGRLLMQQCNVRLDPDAKKSAVKLIGSHGVQSQSSPTTRKHHAGGSHNVINLVKLGYGAVVRHFQ